MNYWFDCKVSYERQADSMGMKKVSESYLVDALSFTEAEARIIKEVTPFVSVGELEVVNIRRARIAELFLSENDGQMAAYEIASITDTQILDVYRYEAPQQ